MLTGDVAESNGVAEGEAGVEEGVVGRAVELAAQIADCVKALDDLAVLGGDAAVKVDIRIDRKPGPDTRQMDFFF